MSEETRLGADDGDFRKAAVERLCARIDAHDAEAAAIDLERKKMGIDPRRLKNIMATRKTLAALMGSGLVEGDDAEGGVA